MDQYPMDWQPVREETASHNNCLATLLLLLGDDHEMSRLSDLLHYTTIAEREYAQVCRLRHR